MLRQSLLLFFLTLAMLSGSLRLTAQVVPDSIASLFKSKPQAQFLKDSAQVGELIPYTVYFDYPEDFQVLFPDSSYHYAPFEFASKDYFQTKTEDGTSRDSVVYYLSTFELEPRQSLALPVFVLYKGDTIPYFPDRETVILDEIIRGGVDTLHIQAQTNLLPTQPITNYPLWIAVGIGVVMIIIALIILFGGALVRSLRAFRLRRAYQRYQKSFDQSVNQATKEPNTTHVEQSLQIWKNYLQRLENRPYSSYTTREISHVISDPKLVESLQAIDRVIYAGKSSDLSTNFDQLKAVSNRLYLERRKAVLSKNT